MKRTIVFIFSFISLISINAQIPQFDWAGGLHGQGALNNGNTVIADISGNVYYAGRFADSVDFDLGANVFQVSAEGTHSVFISKLDISGNLIWVRNFPASGSATSMQFDLQGNICIVGTYGNDTVDFDPGIGVHQLFSQQQSSFLLKLDQDGNFISVKEFNYIQPIQNILPVAEISINHLTINTDGSILLAGNFRGTMDMDPGLSESIINSTVSNNGDYAAFIIKLDSQGNFIWVKTLSSTVTSFSPKCTIKSI